MDESYYLRLGGEPVIGLDIFTEANTPCSKELPSRSVRSLMMGSVEIPRPRFIRPLQFVLIDLVNKYEGLHKETI